MATPAPVQQIDVDELAREKVQEIEKLLDSSENHKLDEINSWLSVLKQIITAADLHRTNDKNGNQDDSRSKKEADDSIYADYSDDNEQFNAIDLTEQFATNSVKWTIRVHAFKLVHRLVQIFSKSRSSKSPIALRHLPDLVRLSFVAATSPYDDLKLQGFEMFKVIINKFAFIEEKEFQGHSILEQYKTQVLSALKPAFNMDAPPYITAIASQVCSTWICRGLERDPLDLKRTYQLMLMTIDKLENQSINQNSKLYTESEMEQERLDILGSWAQLYIRAKELDENILHEQTNRVSNSLLSAPRFDSKHLNELVSSQIDSLIDKWWEALKDYALLIMPAPRIVGTAHDSEHVYTREVALRLFGPVWPKLILACSIWLSSKPESEKLSCENNHSISSNEKEAIRATGKSFLQHKTSRTKYLNFICGILMKEFCRYHSDNSIEKDSLPEATLFAIRSLFFLVTNNETKSAFVSDLAVSQEFYTILYSILVNKINSKSIHRPTLRNLLDIILSLVVSKVAKDPKVMSYSVARLVDTTKKDIKNMADETNGFETLKLNLSIRTYGIIRLIKSEPKLVTELVDLREALLEIFREILSFESDLSLGSSLMNLLKEVQSIVPKELAASIHTDLFETKAMVVKNICKSLGAEDLSSNNSIKYLEIYLDSMQSSISFVSIPDERQKLVSTFVKTLYTAFQNPSLRGNKFDWRMKYVEGLRVKYPDEFKEAIKPEMEKAFGNNPRQENKTEVAAKKQASKISGSTKPKIVLRADFSNFYEKKS